MRCHRSVDDDPGRVLLRPVVKRQELEDKERRIQRTRRGFTLVELLVVIALLGVLVGIVILVIDVPVMRKKARQAVGRDNLAKVCTSFVGCLVSSPTGAVDECSTWTQLDVDVPVQPPGAVYNLVAAGPTVSVDGCSVSCNSKGNISFTAESGGVCYIQ